MTLDILWNKKTKPDPNSPELVFHCHQQTCTTQFYHFPSPYNPCICSRVVSEVTIVPKTMYTHSFCVPFRYFSIHIPWHNILFYHSLGQNNCNTETVKHAYIKYGFLYSWCMESIRMKLIMQKSQYKKYLKISFCEHLWL
jgi:hypothetical protein